MNLRPECLCWLYVSSSHPSVLSESFLIDCSVFPVEWWVKGVSYSGHLHTAPHKDGLYIQMLACGWVNHWPSHFTYSLWWETTTLARYVCTLLECKLIERLLDTYIARQWSVARGVALGDWFYHAIETRLVVNRLCESVVWEKWSVPQSGSGYILSLWNVINAESVNKHCKLIWKRMHAWEWNQKSPF